MWMGLTGDIDDQGFLPTRCGLQRADQHIEYAKQDTGTKENVGKGKRHSHTLPHPEVNTLTIWSGEEVADQRQHGTK